MSQLTQNLTDNEIKFLKFQKDRGFDAKTSFKKLQMAKDQGRFGNTPNTQTKQNIPGFDIGVKTGRGISNVGKKLKFQSKPDDSILKSGAKFAGNLPGSTLELGGGLVSAVSDPVGTGKSIKTLAETGVEAGLNKIFGTKTGQSILKKLGAPEKNLAKVREGKMFTSKENEALAQLIGKEYGRLKNEPGRVKELIVENPVDILATVSGGAGALSKVGKAGKVGKVGKVGVMAKSLEKISKSTNPLLIQKKGIELGLKAGSQTKNMLFPQRSLDDIVMQVSQGKAKDLEPFKNALSQIDTKDIKTYTDLDNAFSNKIKVIAQKQDSLLSTDPKYLISNLSTTQGKRSINYIEESIKDLEAVGNAENDLVLLNKVDDIKNKAKLSDKDINDLARFYGTKFREKAFNKMGDPKSSVSATRFENNRVGIKNVSRQLLPDDTMRLLDGELTNLYEAQRLTSKMVDKVDNLKKKFTERGLGYRATQNVIKIMDNISLGSIKGVRDYFITRNEGSKVLNNFDLQERLNKNLKAIEKLNKESSKLSDEEFIKKTKAIFLGLLEQQNGQKIIK